MSELLGSVADPRPRHGQDIAGVVDGGGRSVRRGQIHQVRRRRRGAGCRRERGAGKNGRPRGDVPGRVEVPLHIDVLSRLGLGRLAQRDRQVRQRAGQNISVLIGVVSLHERALAVHQRIARIQTEVAVPRELLPGGGVQDEKTRPVDRKIAVDSRRINRPRREVRADRTDLRSQTDLAGIGPAKIRIRRCSRQLCHIKLRREFDRTRLESDRIDVRDVVSNDIQPLLIGVETRQSGE